MLRIRNGFYAFESALHVFPAQDSDCEIGLAIWNSPRLWKHSYRGMADDLLCFAEDVFGGQFCVRRDGGVHTFDPETGSTEFLAEDLEGWASVVLEDFEILTGFPLVHEWQKRNGPLPAGHRLLPKTPFLAGGAFSIDNLYIQDSVTGMNFRGEMATQIRDLPDGTKIVFDIVE